MSKRLIRDVRGFVHDISAVKALSDQFSNIRLLSDRSLYVLQNLSVKDVGFYSRYGTIDTDGFYTPVQNGTPDAEVVDQTVDLIRRDLNNMAIEDLFECMCSSLQEIAANLGAANNGTCGCDIGTDVETTDGQEGGALPDPVNDIEYTAPDPIVNRKCKAANYIHGGLKTVVAQLDQNSVTTLAFGGISLVLTVVSSILAGAVFGPFGVLVGAVVGASLSLSTLLFKDQVDMADLLVAIEADEAGAICSLYDATSASGARSAYSTHLTDQGATALMVEFVELIFSNNLLNLLFFEWGDSADAIDDATIIHDCSSCGPEMGCPWEWELISGIPAGSGDLTKDGSSRVLSSVQIGVTHYVVFKLETDTPPFAGEDCDGEHTVNGEFQLESYSVGGGIFSTRNYSYWLGDQYTTGPNFPIPQPDQTVYQGAYVQFAAAVSFSITLKLAPGNFQ